MSGKRKRLLHRNFSFSIFKESVFSPTTAVFDATEMERMGNIAINNLKASMDALFTLNEKEIQEVYKTEDQINLLNHAITDYLVKVNQTTITTEDKKIMADFFMW